MDQTHSCKLRNVLVAGCADFCPNPTPNSSSKFEHLAPVVARARNWIQQNASLNVVNVQTIDYKLKSNHSQLSPPLPCSLISHISFSLTMLV